MSLGSLPPPTAFFANGLQVHLWSIPLEMTGREEKICREVLSEDELLRAARYLQNKHRHRFIAGRARQRAILAAYLNCPPHQLTFRYANLGKPSLVEPVCDINMSFNISNSADKALLAISNHPLELGVDIERPRNLSDLVGLARRYFHPREIAALEELSGDEQRQMFFRLWTRKEAYLKAIGTGLTFPLHDVFVSFEETDSPQIHEIAGDVKSAREWQLHVCPCDPPYVAALAYRSPVRARITSLEWQSD